MEWSKALDEARTAVELIEVVEEFLATRPKSYWEGVPEKLRPPVIANDAELERWHQALIKAIGEITSPGTRVQELCVLSLRATVRIHQIRLKRASGGSTNDGEFSAAPRAKDRSGK